MLTQTAGFALIFRTLRADAISAMTSRPSPSSAKISLSETLGRFLASTVANQHRMVRALHHESGHHDAFFGLLSRKPMANRLDCRPRRTVRTVRRLAVPDYTDTADEMRPCPRTLCAALDRQLWAEPHPSTNCQNPCFRPCFCLSAATNWSCAGNPP